MRFVLNPSLVSTFKARHSTCAAALSSSSNENEFTIQSNRRGARKKLMQSVSSGEMGVSER